jgi:hypothetical protein
LALSLFFFALFARSTSGFVQVPLTPVRFTFAECFLFVRLAFVLVEFSRPDFFEPFREDVPCLGLFFFVLPLRKSDLGVGG